jgi:hypothetical protein
LLLYGPGCNANFHGQFDGLPNARFLPALACFNKEVASCAHGLPLVSLV